MSSTWYTAPILAGKHVRLEPLTVDHADGLFAATRNPDIWTWLLVHQPSTSEDMRTWVTSRLSTDDVIAFAQIDTRTGEIAGTTSYYDIDPKHRSLAIGYTWIGTAWQRTGLNSEAKLMLLEHAFDSLGAVRVVLQNDSRNLRAQHAIERLGVRYEGVLRQHRTRPDGTLRDTVIYSVLDTEWPGVAAHLRARLAEPVGASRPLDERPCGADDFTSGCVYEGSVGGDGLSASG